MQTFSISKQANPFNNYQLIFVALIVLSGINWGIPQTVIDALVAMQTTWTGLYQKSVNKSTKSEGATAERNLFFDAYYAEITGIMEKYIITNLNPLITAANKIALRIKAHTATRVPIVTPTSTPQTQIVIKESLAHHFSILDSLTGKIGKPKGVVFAELKYIIGIVPPASVDECTKNIFIASKANFVVFDAADKNKNAYYFARWINKKGEMGPYTLIFSSVIA